MLRIFLLVLLSMSFVGVVKAQEAGPEAEEVKKKIIQMENEKIPLILEGGEAYAHWLETYMDDDLVIVQPDGGFTTKPRSIAAFRSHEFKVVTMVQDGHDVRVYAKGTTAVVTYQGLGSFELRGKTFPVHQQFTDVWVKEKDGVWRRVSHNIHGLPVSAGADK